MLNAARTLGAGHRAAGRALAWALVWEGIRREDALLCEQLDCGLMERPLLSLGLLFDGGDGS